jgi:hypothetical protein
VAPLTSLSVKDKAQWPLDGIDEIFYMPGWTGISRISSSTNACRRVVPMNRIRSAGRIRHGDHQTFLTGKSARSFDMSGVT